MADTLRFIYTSLEISLWKNIIPLLEETHPVGLVIQKIYEIYEKKTWIHGIEKIFTWVILGLGSGFIMGLVWSLFN